MFGTTTRLSILAVLVAAALPAVLASPTAADKRQTYNLGGLTVDFGQLAEGLQPAAAAAAVDEPVVAAASLVARVKARTIRRRSGQYQINLCPGSFRACALPSGSFECLDVSQELNSCGGCLEEGGMDCEQIPFVEGVSCAASKCEIHSCMEGYRPNLDKSACIPKAESVARRFHKMH